MYSPISNNRTQLLLENFYEFSFNDKSPNKKLYDSIHNPLELHFIADMYNWDDGTEVLSWIVNDKLCDEGTAKLIFWRAEPHDFTECETTEDAEYMGKDVFLLLKNILDNFKRGFYKQSKIPYTPADDVDIEYISTKAKWIIPKYLQEPT